MEQRPGQVRTQREFITPERMSGGVAVGLVAAGILGPAFALPGLILGAISAELLLKGAAKLDTLMTQRRGTQRLMQ